MPIGRIAVVGGTGPQGRGLALRLASAGIAVTIGSRDAARAEAVAASLRETVPHAGIAGASNADAVARADTVVLAMAADGLVETLATLAPRLAGRLVIDVVVPLAMRDGLVEHAPPSGFGSAGELLHATLRESRVVGAFKTIPASHLLAIDEPLEGDVFVCGDEAAARAEVAALVARIPKLRPVDAGPVRTARSIESLTALLVNLNRAHRAHTSIRVLGLRA